MKIITPKKLVVEQRFLGTLRSSAAVVDIGLDLSEEYPNFRRGVHDVQVISKSRTESVSVHSNRWVCESNNPKGVDGFLEKLNSIKSVIEKRINRPTYKRTGIRVWYALSEETPFREIVSRFHKRFTRDDTPTDALGISAEIIDTMYRVDFTKQEWLGHLTCGPMEKKQWFKILEYDAEAEKVVSANIPDRFIFVDIDLYVDDHTESFTIQNFEDALSNSEKVVRWVLKKYKS